MRYFCFFAAYILALLISVTESIGDENVQSMSARLAELRSQKAAQKAALQLSGPEIIKPKPTLSSKTMSNTMLKNTYFTGSKIRDDIYLGGERGAGNRVWLDSLGITHILNMASGTVKEFYPDDSAFQYRSVNLRNNDAPVLMDSLQDSFKFIDNARSRGGKVLVHCSGGISRSASTVVAYLMYREGLSFEEAHAIVKNARPQVDLESGFVDSLSEWTPPGYEA